jgi:hypothetical protein
MGLYRTLFIKSVSNEEGRGRGYPGGTGSTLSTEKYQAPALSIQIIIAS